ncbi:MAG: hypothetical protein ACOCU6_01400 [Nanoarchaeota archaeon]
MGFMNELEVFSHAIGYRSTKSMFLRMIVPFVAVSIVAGFLVRFLTSAPLFLSLVIIGLGFVTASLMPIIRYNMLKADIQNNIHYMITYAGTLSTMHISHYILFKRLREKSFYGHISSIFSQIYDLTTRWHLDYPSACKHMSKRTPSRILRNFLDRTALAIGFGEDLNVFLEGEQEAVLEDYAIEYQKSLENIKMVQEFFMALTVSFAFSISVLLFATLMMNINVGNMMMWSFIALFVIDAVLVAIIFSIIPRDTLFNSPDHLNKYQRYLPKALFISITISIFLFTSLYLLTTLPWLVSFSISIIPFFYVSHLSKQEESRVKSRDNQFPSFMRVLGSAIEVRAGAVKSAISQIKVHDFGQLNSMLENLYRRWVLAEDKFASWSYFTKEGGSKLITNFTKIFSESIYLGGNGTKIGEIISKNIIHQLSLRKLRDQQASSMKGLVYGLFFGIIITVFISVDISRFLIDTFSMNDSQAESMGFVQSIFPNISAINFDFVFTMVALMLVFHAFASSFMMKLVEGGSLYSALTDFIILVWIITILSLIVPGVVGSILPESTSMMQAGAVNTTI